VSRSDTAIAARANAENLRNSRQALATKRFYIEREQGWLLLARSYDFQDGAVCSPKSCVVERGTAVDKAQVVLVVLLPPGFARLQYWSAPIVGVLSTKSPIEGMPIWYAG
jgi:hypothetical protein